jgi:hypothetical protein
MKYTLGKPINLPGRRDCLNNRGIARKIRKRLEEQIHHSVWTHCVVNLDTSLSRSMFYQLDRKLSIELGQITRKMEY